MTTPLCLIYDKIAPGQSFHAALLEASRTLKPGATLHRHDFYEVMYVLDGSAQHRINGQAQPMQTGDLFFIRPDDCHAIRGRSGGRVYFINVAFPATAWKGFSALYGLENWEQRSGHDHGILARVPPPRQAECGQVFHRALRAFHEMLPAWASQMELCSFWANTLPLLTATHAQQSAVQEAAMPPWLSQACDQMQAEGNLKAGLNRFIEVSHVSSAHLSRTLKACCGKTPTEYINELRLTRAATLLATTPREILDIALDCGFENLSYFYRRFRSRFSKPPHAYRLAARSSIAP